MERRILKNTFIDWMSDKNGIFSFQPFGAGWDEGGKENGLGGWKCNIEFRGRKREGEKRKVTIARK